MTISMAHMKELRTQEEFLRAYPIMRQLRTELTEAEYVTLLKNMGTEGYQLLALWLEDEIVALAGCKIQTNFYYGKHVYVFDLITDEASRSKTYGKQLLESVEQWARAEGCTNIALASATHRVGAHRFYEEKMHFTKPSYEFVKKL